MIRYDPGELLKKIAPARKIEKLVRGNLTLKRAALSFVDDIDFLDKKRVASVALEVIKGYRRRVREKTDSKADLVDDPAQLIQRVQNEVIFQVKEGIVEKYAGEKYEWMPSDSEEPRPEHQLNYGMVFTVGEGEMPGDEPGCKCGMNILVAEDKLEL